MTIDKKIKTRRVWLDTLEKWQSPVPATRSGKFFAPGYDDADRDLLREIHDSKIKAVAPFLYENSAFYRRRFDRLGLLPSDIASVDDLDNWPVIDKSEMMEDVAMHPPFGTYTTVDDEVWGRNGWMMFSSSGTTGTPRPFRYTQNDRRIWAWGNARALYGMGIGDGDSAIICSGYGPHVFAWTAQMGLAELEIPVIPGGGMDSAMRASIIERFKPTVLICTPSYALHLGRVIEEMGQDPRASSIRLIFVGGEPALGIPNTRQRIEELWGAKLSEFYGCTEAAPSAGGYSCSAVIEQGGTFTHFMEDLQYWELVSPDSHERLPIGERGLTVCSNLCSEASPQLRFLVGDYTVLDDGRCECGRYHMRALGGMSGRADDLINLRGIKMYPVQLEQAVRQVDGVGDEYEVHIENDSAGMGVMKVRVEHTDNGPRSDIATQVEREIREGCEIKASVEVLPLGTLPKTEFKAKRIYDHRG